jgi:RimJ/RimL family protein N-acetyltransferase
MTFPRELLTARMRLRQWRDEDVEPLARLYADPGYLEHMPALDLDATVAQVDWFRRRWDELGFGLWAAEDLSSGAFLGRIGVTRHDDWPLEAGPVEVGWTLAPEARGRGLALEGGRAALTAAFRHLELDRVLSITTPANRRSRRVMERLGLSYRGEAHWHGQDVVWYAIDRSLWSA